MSESPTLGDVIAVLERVADKLSRPAPVLLTRADCCALLVVSRSTFDRLRGSGEFGPAAISLGGSLRWLRIEVEAWLAHLDRNGNLYDSQAWPTVWASLRPS